MLVHKKIFCFNLINKIHYKSSGGWQGQIYSCFIFLAVRLLFLDVLPCVFLVSVAPQSKVSFFVRKSGAAQSRSGYIVYEEVVSATGGIWNRVGNSFIVPIKAMYFINLRVKSSADEWLGASIMKDLSSVQDLHTNNLPHAGASASIVMEYDAGQQIAARLNKGTLVGGRGDSDKLNHLSGFLVFLM